MAALASAITLVQEIAHRSSSGRAFQMIKALMGLAAMILIPTVLVAWARKNYRP